MPFFWLLLGWIKNAWDWTQFGDAVLAVVQTWAGAATVSSLSAMLYGAWTGASGYEVALMGLFVFLAIHLFAVLRILKRPRAVLQPVLSVRVENGLYGPNREWFSIGTRNSGKATLSDVVVRALDSWFTREVLAVGLMGSDHNTYRQPVSILQLPLLHPNVTETREVFGLGYGQQVSSPDYILNTVQQFTLEIAAGNTRAVQCNFEFDPNARPMLRMLS